MSAKILLIEDNPKIMKLNREGLTMRGYFVLEAATLAEGRELFQAKQPDLIILDIMLPDGDGRILCEQLRQGSRVPILFLSGKGQEDDMLAGYDAGGDDYLQKPYSLDMLIKRVEALLRRSGYIPDIITKGSLTGRVSSGESFVNGENLRLTATEQKLLCFLVQDENKSFGPEYLYEKVWGQNMIGDANALKTAASKLRAKLKNTGYTITSQRGGGYCFERD
jgi:DNA-binding response OmpR family regulator